jgi:hypothetical protein
VSHRRAPLAIVADSAVSEIFQWLPLPGGAGAAGRQRQGSSDPSRLASWWGEVEGDLRVGGEYRARIFASGWEGTGRVEACEALRRLLVT